MAPQSRLKARLTKKTSEVVLGSLHHFVVYGCEIHVFITVLSCEVNKMENIRKPTSDIEIFFSNFLRIVLFKLFLFLPNTFFIFTSFFFVFPKFFFTIFIGFFIPRYLFFLISQNHLFYSSKLFVWYQKTFFLLPQNLITFLLPQIFLILQKFFFDSAGLLQDNASQMTHNSAQTTWPMHPVLLVPSLNCLNRSEQNRL